MTARQRKTLIFLDQQIVEERFKKEYEGCENSYDFLRKIRRRLIKRIRSH